MSSWRRRRADAGLTAPEPSEQEQQITHGLESLREATVREIMTPRVDVVALPEPVRFADVAAAVRRSGHSHFPVYEHELDRLLGVLFVKDLFHLDEASGDQAGDEPTPDAGRGAVDDEGVPSDGGDAHAAPTTPARPAGSAGGNGRRGIPADLDVTRRLREPYVVPESRSALEVLADMRRRRRGFAVVVDEYGGFAGVLTVNDLVSELVGDLRDEFDRSRSPAVVRIDARRFLVDGACAVDEVRDELGIDVPDGEYVTLGGFLFDAFGRIPSEGDSIERDGWTLRVARMDRRRVAKVVIEAPSATMSDGTGSTRPADGK